MPRLIRAALERAELDGAAEVATGVDVVGDLAIVRVPGLTAKEKRRFGKALIEEMGNVRGVFEQEGAIEGEHRLRTLRHIGGENSTMTVHRENGCSFKVDIARCYFSPRLSTERLRVAKLARKSERVFNMFAGVGPFSIEVAKISGARVTSCEVNGFAAGLHLENDVANKVDGLVDVVEDDSRRLAARTDTKFDRVLMPHPSMANEYMEDAVRVTRPGGTIHYYRHVLGRDDGEAAKVVEGELKALLPSGSKWKTKRVREVGPRWVEVVADAKLPR